VNRIEIMRAAVLAGEHHVHRQPLDPDGDARFTEKLAHQGVPPVRRAAARLAYVLDRELPVVLTGERIALLRTVRQTPEIFTDAERAAVASAHRIHELGKVCNISPDYATTIRQGLDAPRAQALAALEETVDPASVDFHTAVVDSIDAVLRLADRYAEEAARVGNDEVAATMARVPRAGATTFVEALQMFRLLHFALWCSFNYHNTVGRFDQYMWPYLRADLQAARLDESEARELVEEFFISFNRDSDLYPGVQQGDNGQSLVLGGVDAQGADAWNLLSDLSLQASLELRLIDPKVNVRVSSSTPLERYVAGTRLTAQGLGFPQYSNDDVVIPGLVDLGYAPVDARDYVVAACWEFIVPGVGMEIPNIAALSFPAAVDTALRAVLPSAQDFAAVMNRVRQEVRAQARELAAATAGVVMEPSPFLSVLMTGCLDRGRDVSEGLLYNNYGIHGAGLSTATDSLAAVRMAVFERHLVTPAELIGALDADYDGHEALRDLLRNDAPKLGNDDDAVDALAADLLQTFADALADVPNDRGGRFRAGTGSAMFYVTHAATLGATPDGRKKGDFLSANLAPSLGVRVKGPLSVLRSFAKLPVRAAVNGGPVTMEVHDTVFRTPESTTKVAMLVRGFIEAGGHQLQINAVNRDILLDAQQHPERHRNLIVRVWGWSAYFVELDKQYQDHIIQRVELVA